MQLGSLKSNGAGTVGMGLESIFCGHVGWNGRTLVTTIVGIDGTGIPLAWSCSRGLWPELSKMEKCLERIPLLKGEGAAKRRVRGEEKHLFTPHPGPPSPDVPPSPFRRGMREYRSQLFQIG
jgi:hypothetical protein